MADEWKTNDSARTMVQKYNQLVKEMNTIAPMTLKICQEHVYTVPSEFDIADEGEFDGL